MLTEREWLGRDEWEDDLLDTRCEKKPEKSSDKKEMISRLTLGSRAGWIERVL